VRSAARYQPQSIIRKVAWAAVAVAAWFVWLAVLDRVLGAMLGAALASGSHPDSNLAFFAALYAAGGLVLISGGYAGNTLLGLAPLPFAAWKPGALVVAASALASLAMSTSTPGGATTTPTVLVLRSGFAPLAVLVGIGIAARRQRARERRAEVFEVN